MKIHEVTEDDGSLSPIELVGSETGDGLAIKRGGKTLPLPEGALDAVMKRYGQELDPAAKVTHVDTLWIGDKSVVHVRHLDFYDVIARDWLVYEGKAALATMVAAALEHLARAAVPKESLS